MKAECAQCGVNYERPKYTGDKEKIYLQLFCSEDCEENWDIMLETQDWPRDPALKYQTPTGEIACPHCGNVHCGLIKTPICDWCEKNYWEEVKDETELD